MGLLSKGLRAAGKKAGELFEDAATSKKIKDIAGPPKVLDKVDMPGSAKKITDAQQVRKMKEAGADLGPKPAPIPVASTERRDQLLNFLKKQAGARSDEEVFKKYQSKFGGDDIWGMLDRANDLILKSKKKN